MDNLYIDKNVISEESIRKLEQLENPKAIQVIEKYISLCNPAKVTVISDDEEDIDYIRKLCIKNSEESELKIKGHTICKLFLPKLSDGIGFTDLACPSNQ